MLSIPKIIDQGHESQLLRDYSYLIGVDEVGRGPLAGPVVSAGVWIKCSKFSSGKKLFGQLEELPIGDSKKISAVKRKTLLNLLGIKLENLKESKQYLLAQDEDNSLEFCLSVVDHQIIDQMNILEASLFSMAKNVETVFLGEANNAKSKSLLLIDGNKSLEKYFSRDSLRQLPLIKGDQKSKLIGLASIIAKEYRDFLMNNYAKLYPQYGLDQNAGYPTKKHLAALKNWGPGPIHRKTFKGVKEHFLT